MVTYHMTTFLTALHCKKINVSTKFLLRVSVCMNVGLFFKLINKLIFFKTFFTASTHTYAAYTAAVYIYSDQLLDSF